MIRSCPYRIENNDTIVLSFDPLQSDDDLPCISVVTITRDRPFFYPLMIRNIQTCDYPVSKLEWIVLEDGCSRFDEFVQQSGIVCSSLRYVYIGDRTERVVFPIGYKRNRINALCTHDIVVHMDDDDYYPPESVLARVRTLMKYNVRCVGCETVRTFHLFTEHTCEATETCSINMSESSLAYKKSFWLERPFLPKCSTGEGIAFLKDRYTDCLALPSVFVITQFDHSCNTVKRSLPNTIFHGKKFLDSIDEETRRFVLHLRDSIAFVLPDTQKIVSFMKRFGSVQKASRFLNTLDTVLQRHPLCLQVRRTYTTHKRYDIVFYCGSGSYMSFNRVWDYENCLNIGGSEEAVLRLASCFALSGRQVHVFNERDTEFVHSTGVVFRPWYTFCPLDPCRTVIVWRDPSNLCMPFRARQVLFDVHDFIPLEWLRTIERVDKIMLKSEYHRCVVPLSMHPKCVVIPNGIVLSSLPHTSRENALLCTSSPERCWPTLFRLARDLEHAFPQYRIIHAYTLENVRMSSHWQRLRQYVDHPYPNIDIRGHVTDIEQLYRTCRVFVYPTTFPEIDCVSLTKAIVYGCRCVHTSSGAMKEKERYGTFCVPTRTETCENKTFDLNDEEYTVFRDTVYDVLRHEDSTQDSKAHDMFRIETVHESWKSVLGVFC